MIIDIHGGPESQTRPRWNPGAQYIANVLGATVILPNVRGSDGYGTRYLNLDNGPKREDSVKDIGALLDWIAQAARTSIQDGSRSTASPMAATCSWRSMTHYSDRLVGGVERYGISDFITFLNNTEAYRRDNRRAEYGDERDPAMRAVFKRINPLANVAKITKPMLVMQGANDPRVPKSESDQVVAGIRANGVEAWYVVYRRRGPRLPEEAQQRPPPRSRDGVPASGYSRENRDGARGLILYILVTSKYDINYVRSCLPSRIELNRCARVLPEQRRLQCTRHVLIICSLTISKRSNCGIRSTSTILMDRFRDISGAPVLSVS